MAKKSSRRKRPAVTKKSSNRIRRKPTFKQTSRFFIPWPAMFFILLCIGVLLTGWTFRASADDSVAVTAKIPAAPLSEPAIITSPADGARFSAIPILVKGTCPSDSYVKLYRNDFFSGSILCNADKTFQLSIDLFEGANQLKARVFNKTDDEGPQSSAITVYYDIPQPTGEEGGVAKLPPAAIAPFVIKTDFKYIGYYVGQIVQWKLEVSGGQAPYAINIDWGDGQNTILSKKEAGEVTVSHIYKKPGSGPNNDYTIKISGSDSLDNQAHLELFVIVNSSNLPSIIESTLPRFPFDDHWLWVAWPAYLVVALMTISYWLGEREEFLVLRRRGLLRR